MAHVLIIGAGISGLSVAEFLRDSHQVTVLEAGSEPGGKVRSERVQGFTFDKAANGWLDNGPGMQRLIARLNLGQQLIQAPLGDPRYVVSQGQMVALPSKPQGLLGSPLLTIGAKLRLIWELFAPGFDGEESIGQFMRRRIGPQPTERLVQPFVTGIYAGDVDNLSMQACFPALKDLEAEHGSLLRAVRKQGPPTPGRLTSLRGGAGALGQALAARSQVLFNHRAMEISHTRGQWTVVSDQGTHHADALVLAGPGHAMTQLKGLDSTLAGSLGAIPYAPVAVVCQGLPKDGWSPPKGFGVLIPKAEKLGILGTLFTSSIFPSRAPEDGVTIRTIVGGALFPRQAALEPDALLEIARRDNAALLGPLPEPRVTRVYKHVRAIPQYTLGHLGRVAAVREATQAHPGLFVTGNHLDGVAVKACADAGEKLAGAVIAYLNT
jgi:oxygen-dependent protoporphyrinogen oxidase